MIKAILFDCFGVLVGKHYYETYRAAGGDPEKDKEFIDSVLTKANTGTISSEESRAIMAKQLELRVDEYVQIVKREQQPNYPLLDYIATKLKPRYKLGILSNANRGVIERKLSPEQLALFDTRIISAEVGFIKPDPNIYLIALDRLATKPSETIFIDDLPDYLEPAKSLGIHTIHYTGLDTLKADLSIPLV
jgi:glucose-1-phosphatase